MTNNIPYISSTVLQKVASIAAKKYNIKPDLFGDDSQIGMVLVQNQKKVYKKRGRNVASDLVDFVLLDNSLHKIGVVKRKEVKKYYPNAKKKEAQQ
jgi:hypothetical protein